MIVDCISDLHGFYPELEGGDLLIVAGDLTARDTGDEYDKFSWWLKGQSYKKRIFISGNHDNNMKKLGPQKYKCPVRTNVELFEYLCDSGTEFEGLKIWGSPWTKTFRGQNPECMAFSMNSEADLFDKWELIPGDVDILITHTPALGILDRAEGINNTRRCGSKGLYGWLKYVGRPLLHVFGHIHEGYGVEEVFATRDGKMMKSVNASHVNKHYEPVNKPVRVIL